MALPNLFIKLPTYFSQGKRKKNHKRKNICPLYSTSLCKQRTFLSMLLQIHKEKKIRNKIHSTKRPGSMSWKENLWTGCAAERRLYKARLRAGTALSNEASQPVITERQPNAKKLLPRSSGVRKRAGGKVRGHTGGLTGYSFQCVIPPHCHTDKMTGLSPNP